MKTYKDYLNWHQEQLLSFTLNNEELKEVLASNLVPDEIKERLKPCLASDLKDNSSSVKSSRLSTRTSEEEVVKPSDSTTRSEPNE
jgi:hypothetical protein